MEIRKIDKITAYDKKPTEQTGKTTNEAMFGCNFDPDDGIKVEKNTENTVAAGTTKNIKTDESGNTIISEYKDGKLISEKHYEKGKKQASLTEEFSNGKRIRTTYTNGKLEARNVYGPNGEPLELMKRTISAENEKIYINYIFRPDGTRQAEEIYTTDNTQTPVFTTEYTPDGKKITKTLKAEEDGRYSITEYTTGGREKHKTYYNDKNLTSISEKITYDRKGRQEEQIFYDANGNVLPHKNIFADFQ